MRKTSVAVDARVMDKLQQLYSMTPSEIIRKALEYMLERKPEIQDKTDFKETAHDQKGRPDDNQDL